MNREICFYAIVDSSNPNRIVSIQLTRGDARFTILNIISPERRAEMRIVRGCGRLYEK